MRSRPNWPAGSIKPNGCDISALGSKPPRAIKLFVRLSIIIPYYNEKTTIPRLCDALDKCHTELVELGHDPVLVKTERFGPSGGSA